MFQINGKIHSWASIVVQYPGLGAVAGITSINYGDKVSETKVYGAGRKPIGRTAGKYEANDGEMELFKYQHDQLVRLLGDGFADAEATVTVAYVEPGVGVVTDVLERVRIVSHDASNSEGADPTKVKVGLAIMEVRWGGRRAVRS